jgi:DNA end-binding protein Ku
LIMARSVWTGALSFGLVSIPVSLYPATQPKDVRFHLFDKEGRRVRYRRVVEESGGLDREPEVDEGTREVEGGEAPTIAPESESESAPARGDEPGERPASGSEREVAYEDLVRGYEVEPETYVFFENEEIERARPRRSHTIDLEHFVQLEEIDPVYFEKAYHVAPRRDVERPYLLLLRTLQETRRVGIGRFVLRTKPHLVALRPMENVLALETLYFGDEVRDPSALLRGLDEAPVSQRELEIASQLVETLATSWDPANYEDEYRQELLRMVAERTPEHMEEATEPALTSGVEELMAALRKSVEDAKKGRDRKPKRRKVG